MSIFGWWFIRLNDALDSVTVTINILYGWSGICGQSKLCSFYVFFCNIKAGLYHFLHYFFILLHLVASFSLTKSLLVPYANVSIESIDCILMIAST